MVKTFYKQPHPSLFEVIETWTPEEDAEASRIERQRKKGELTDNSRVYAGQITETINEFARLLEPVGHKDLSLERIRAIKRAARKLMDHDYAEENGFEWMYPGNVLNYININSHTPQAGLATTLQVEKALDRFETITRSEAKRLGYDTLSPLEWHRDIFGPCADQQYFLFGAEIDYIHSLKKKQGWNSVIGRVDYVRDDAGRNAQIGHVEDFEIGSLENATINTPQKLKQVRNKLYHLTH